MSRRRSVRTPEFESGFSEDAATLLGTLGRIAAGRGTRAFLVGGPVRDLLLGRASPDIDVAVEGDSRGFGRALARAVGGRFVYHARFLTGTVVFDDPCSGPSGVSHIDICRTRVERYAEPTVLPAVRPAAIEDDLARRDFSINAMAWELTTAGFGRLIDPHRGRADLRARMVRVLHERSFRDDPTRVFRAIRFAVRLGFEIEPATLGLMRDCVRQGLPALLTPERILHELRLACAEEKSLQMFEAFVKEGLIASCFGAGAVSGRVLLAGLRKLAAAGAGADVLYLFLLTRLPTTTWFPITREEREAMEAIRRFPAVRRRLVTANRPSAVFRVLRDVHPAALAVLAGVEAAPVRRRIAQHARMCRTGLSTTGRDLGRFGLTPGPEYRRILDRLLFARLDGRVRSDEEEVKMASALARREMRRGARAGAQKASNGVF